MSTKLTITIEVSHDLIGCSATCTLGDPASSAYAHAYWPWSLDMREKVLADVAHAALREALCQRS